LSLEWSQSMVQLSLERQMREADVGSRSADTIKLSFRSQCFEMASGLIRPVPDSNRPKETAATRGRLRPGINPTSFPQARQDIREANLSIALAFLMQA
jgi:hypothetical protein